MPLLCRFDIAKAKRKLLHENLFLFSSVMFPFLHHYSFATVLRFLLCFFMLRKAQKKEIEREMERCFPFTSKCCRIIHVLEIIETKNSFCFSNSAKLKSSWRRTKSCNVRAHNCLLRRWFWVSSWDEKLRFSKCWTCK